VGTAGEVTGVDISADMLARARQRSPARTPARFLRADATSHVFKAERADLIYSRFGVMFFERPDAAFANLFRALRRGGRLAFACWREPKLNPLLMLPLREAYKHVPPLPPLGPEDPGPFSFMSEERVRRILSGAGFASIEMLPVDLSLDVAANQGIDHAVRMALSIGPASRALEGQSHGKIDEVEQAIRAAMAEHVQGDSVMLPAAVWIVSASKQ
jgi:SAM-dependent methyltransferase